MRADQATDRPAHPTSDRAARPGAPGRSSEATVALMGSQAHLIVTGEDAAEQVRWACQRLEALEARWSRFRPDSEISALNRCAGRWVTVSPETVQLVTLAVEAWRMTGGRFDPTVLGAMLRAGYGESLSVAAPRPLPSLLLLGASDIDIAPDRVRLPAGVGFDAGGIGKGLAADLVCQELLGAGASGACVNVGGDLRVAGVSPAGGAWTVAIEHPQRREPLCLVGLADGAVATSTTLKRCWRSVDGEVVHHLIDPFTGLASAGDVTLVSVVASQAWAAEILAKAVLLRGRAHAFEVLPPGLEALVVDRNGSVTASPGFAAYLGGAALPATARPATATVAIEHDTERD